MLGTWFRSVKPQAQGARTLAKLYRAAGISFGGIRRVTHEQPDRRDSGGSGRGGLADVFEIDTANPEYRPAASFHDFYQAGDAEQRMTGWLRTARPDGPGGDVIDVLGNVHDLGNGVDRLSNEKPFGRDPPSANRVQGICAQVNTIGSTRHGYVESIVDEQPRSRSLRALERSSDQVGKRAISEMRLADLHHLDPGFHRVSDLSQQTIARGERALWANLQVAAVGDEMQNQGSTCVSALRG